jgi:hypothetical protein
MALDFSWLRTGKMGYTTNHNVAALQDRHGGLEITTKKR